MFRCSPFARRPSPLLALPVALVFAAGCASTMPTADPVYFPAPPATAHVVHLKSFNRLGELMPSHGTFGGSQRSGSMTSGVGTPAGLAYSDSHLYICDPGLGTVHSWDLSLGVARQIGTGDEAKLSKPVAVAVDRNGRIYVADTARAEVLAFDTDGQLMQRYRPEDRPAYRPVAVAVDDQKLFVADIAAHRIDLFSTVDGELLESFGGVGTEPDRFYFPMGIAVDDSGLVYVSDSLNARVGVFDGKRVFKLSMGQSGNRYGDMGKPRQVAVGPDGVVFVADTEFGCVHLFNPQGQLLMLLGGSDDGPRATPMPVGLAIAPALPEHLVALVPEDFEADYFLFVTNTVGTKRVSLFAVGLSR